MTGGVRVTGSVTIPESELEFSSIRAQGAGGQHVNKASTAVQLRFDIASSGALTDEQKRRLTDLPDQRITRDGVIVIKSQEHRSRERNRAEAVARLVSLLRGGLEVPKPRKPTRPPRRAREERLRDKEKRGQLKKLRGRIRD